MPDEDEEGALNICLPGTSGCLAALNCREEEGRLLCEPGSSERDHTTPLSNDRGDAAPTDRAFDQRASEDQALDSAVQGPDEGPAPELDEGPSLELDAAISLDEGPSPVQDGGPSADAERSLPLDAGLAPVRDRSAMADEGLAPEDQGLQEDSALDVALPAEDAETD